ncbi:unnamed protein product, partial [marine sediment metagenome]
RYYFYFLIIKLFSILSKTRFLKKAKKEGATVINGIDLLVNQAALSF